MGDDKRAFYQYHSCLMEPWDGPAVDRVHRRQADRRRARPQRPAPLALLRHEGRPGDHGVRGGRARHPARATSCRRAGCSRAACSWWTPSRAASSTTRRSSGRSPPQRPYRQWLDENLIHLDDLPAAPELPAPGSRDAAAAPGRVRLHVRGRAHRAHADGARRRRGRGLDGQRHAARGAVDRSRGCSTTISSSSSRRSRTRRSTASARSSSPPPRRASARRATC